MFHPSIKKENLIIIEDNLEDSKIGIRKTGRDTFFAQD
jgi:hypothetical protein